MFLEPCRKNRIDRLQICPSSSAGKCCCSLPCNNRLFLLWESLTSSSMSDASYGSVRFRILFRKMDLSKIYLVEHVFLTSSSKAFLNSRLWQLLYSELIRSEEFLASEIDRNSKDFICDHLNHFDLIFSPRKPS